MVAQLRRYLHEPALSATAAAAVLRAAYLALFAAQVVVAAAVAGAAVALAGPQSAPSGWVAGVAIAASGGQLALGAAITAAGVRNVARAARRLGPQRAEGDAPPDATSDDPARDDAERRVRLARSSALSVALLASVLLSTPAWFGAFAWATGQTATTLAAIGLVIAAGYALGIAQMGALARAATAARGAQSGASEGP